MKQIIFFIVLSITSFSFGQVCQDSVKYKFMDLSVCKDSSMDIVGHDQRKIYIALNESPKNSNGKRKIVQIDARVNPNNLGPKEIWTNEHASFIASANQMALDYDTTYELNGNKFYWSEALAQMGDDKFFTIYSGIIFYKNQFYFLRTGGAEKDSTIKNHILNVASRLKIENTGNLESDYTLQKELMNNILLSVQNEMRLKMILMDFEKFYSNLPDSEKNEESKQMFSKMFSQWNDQTKIYLRGMRQFEKVEILNYNFKPDKTDDKMTVYSGDVLFSLDDKPFKAKIGAVKTGGELFLLVVNSDQKPQKKEEEKK